jgi:hemolysin III
MSAMDMTAADEAEHPAPAPAPGTGTGIDPTVDVDIEMGPGVGVDVDGGFSLWHERPRLRGRLHQLAAVVSVFGLVWLVKAAPNRQSAVAAAVYGVAALLLYLTSATYHVFAKGERARRIMRRLDHSMIYVLIAGTFTPLCVLAMTGWWRWLVLGTVWAGAITGVALKASGANRFPRLGFALYLALGWAGLATFPALAESPQRLALVVTAGVLYTVGAILFSLHWPLPNAKWFGYHEVWHTMVVAAGVLLFVVNLGVVSGAATG